MKRILKDYFTFSKKERTAVILLLCVIAFFMAVPYFYSPRPKPPLLNKALVDFLAENKNTYHDSGIRQNENFAEAPAIKEDPPSYESFAFDPNTIKEESWKRLGIAGKTIRTILNYRNKGGKFRTAEDIRKVWGIKKEDADRLVPLIQIVSAIPARVNDQPKYFTGSSLVARSKAHEIDINTALAEDWRSLPGIGEVLAGRILKFRDRAGGFTSLEQVKKTYGISDSVFQSITPYMKINPGTIPKMDLNKATAYDLKMRLGIPENIARSIITYRQQYGAFQAVDDLKKLVLITDSIYSHVSGYLRVDRQ